MKRFNITKDVASSELGVMITELQIIINNNPNDLVLINILKTIGYVTVDATEAGHKLLIKENFICHPNITRKLVK